MDIFKFVSFTIISLVLIITLKDIKKEMGVLLSIVAAIMLLISSIEAITYAMNLLNSLIEKSGINRNYLEVILKVTGIAYIVEFTKNICVDAGESALGTKIEIAGKLSIVTLTIPIMLSVIEQIVNII